MGTRRGDRPRRAGAYWEQGEYDARFEWGEEGVRRLARAGGVLVVVDVLSFGTAVDVAVGRGASVLPSRWRGEGAEGYARAAGALLAGGRTEVSPERPYSLSPGSILAIPAGTRLVLPSPNGATLAALAAAAGATVLAGCLRNAGAVARAARSIGGPVAVVAAGERWPGGDALRPAVEDLLGAGAILAALGAGAPSPEALAAAAAYLGLAGDVGGHLRACASGRELREAGFGEDVDLAAEADVSETVPVLTGGAFVRWESPVCVDGPPADGPPGRS